MSAPSTNQNTSILVVDDAKITRTILTSTLEKQGFKVTEAKSGSEALEIMETLQPSLILLDYLMPELNGPEVLRKMTERFDLSAIPVIMLTSSDHPDHIERGFAAGAQDYITHPVNHRILVARIASTIRASKDRQMASQAHEYYTKHRQLEDDLKSAKRMQSAQLPGMPMRWSGWRASGALVPSGAVGGDLFNIAESLEDSHSAVLIDVSGHGTAAALMAANVRGELSITLRSEPIEKAFSMLNDSLCKLDTENYACVAVVQTRGSKIRTINAGLPPVAIVRDGKVTQQISSSGVPPGLLPYQTYSVFEVDVLSGDRVVLLSDGLTEPFGYADAVEDSIARLGLDAAELTDEDFDPEVIQRRIHQTLTLAGEEQPDDATVLVLSTLAEEECCDVFPDIQQLHNAVLWAKDRAPQWVDLTALETGLTEALTNAIVHGVLEISSESRTSSPDEYLRTIRERSRDAVSQGESVTMTLSTMESRFAIKLVWPGRPCPENNRQPPDGSLDPLAESGRGMHIIFEVFDEVCWSSDGHQVELVLTRNTLDR